MVFHSETTGDPDSSTARVRPAWDEESISMAKRDGSTRITVSADVPPIELATR